MKIHSTLENSRIYNPCTGTIKKSENTDYLNTLENNNETVKKSLPIASLRIPQIGGAHIANINRYMSEVRQLLRDSGQSLEGKCSISLGVDGSLVVNGSSEDKEKMESILSENKELAENLRNEIIMQEHAERIKKSLAFNKAYAEDANAAVSQYWYLFNESYNVKVVLEIGQDSFRVQVNENYSTN